jgi:redox-sensitive bicupin YhaK (pirin superfamily)
MERPVNRVTQVIAQRSPQVQKKQVVIGGDDYARTSPFLRLSEDWFRAPGGFEEHPHRGMQTVTIVLEGALEHRDHTGAHGVLRAGDVQWMTAGRGVLHSEMPYSETAGGETVHTLQLWLNLPRAMKMCPARYRDQRLADVPVRRLEGAEVRVYAGRSGEVSHPHGSDYPMSLLDVRLKAGARLVQEIAPRERGCLYVLEGRSGVLKAGDVAWFEPGAGSQITMEAASDFRALLFSGEPIDEPVAAYGPFVMNTWQEIEQAIGDYQNGRLIA